MGLLMGVNKVIDIGEPLTSVSDIEEGLAGCWNPSFLQKESGICFLAEGRCRLMEPVTMELAPNEMMKVRNHFSGEWEELRTRNKDSQDAQGLAETGGAESVVALWC